MTCRQLDAVLVEIPAFDDVAGADEARDEFERGRS